jgi:hypothetical protein
MFEVPKGYEGYCRPTILCESDNDQIRKFAKKIADGEKEPLKAAENFYLWVRDKMGWNLVPVIGAKNVFVRRPERAVCIDHVNLLNAMCRSVGIPARYMYLSCEFDFKDERIPKKMGHVVSEIFLDEDWLMVDPTFGAKDSEIIDIHGFGKPNWKSAKTIFRTKNFSRTMAFFSDLWVKASPTARTVRKIMDTY